MMITCSVIFYVCFRVIVEALNSRDYVVLVLFVGLIVTYDYAFINVWKVICFVNAQAKH